MVGAALALLVAGLSSASPAWADGSASYFSALPASGNTEQQIPRFLAVAAPLPDGQVLIAGGQNNSGVALQSAELFNPATNIFTALPASGSTELKAPLYLAGAASLPNGEVLIAGGQNIGAPRCGPRSCSTLRPIRLRRCRRRATPSYKGRVKDRSRRLPDGKVLIAGGQNSGAGAAWDRDG